MFTYSCPHLLFGRCDQCATNVFVHWQKKEASCALLAGWLLRCLPRMSSRSTASDSGTRLGRLRGFDYYLLQLPAEKHKADDLHEKKGQTSSVSAQFRSIHMQSEQHIFAFLYCSSSCASLALVPMHQTIRRYT